MLDPTRIGPMPDSTPQHYETALVLQKNPSHNVVAHIEQAKNSLAALATVYLVTEAAGQSLMARTQPYPRWRLARWRWQKAWWASSQVA
jgi:hypothetical protein